MNTKRNRNKLKVELEVIEAAKRDRKKFSVLYNAYFEQIFRFVHHRVGDQQTAADITQETFLKAMVNLDKFKYKGFPFSSWLYRIAGNEVINHFRKNKKQNEITLNQEQISVVMEDAELDNSDEMQQAMISALNRLKPSHSTMLELRFYEKMSFKQIGEIYGITEANAKVKVYRILKKMKKMITLK